MKTQNIKEKIRRSWDEWRDGRAEVMSGRMATRNVGQKERGGRGRKGRLKEKKVKRKGLGEGNEVVVALDTGTGEGL